MFEGCASLDGLSAPIHKADTVAKAVAWANGYQHENIVEYGISLSAEAQRLLGEG